MRKQRKVNISYMCNECRALIDNQNITIEKFTDHTSYAERLYGECTFCGWFGEVTDSIEFYHGTDEYDLEEAKKSIAVAIDYLIEAKEGVERRRHDEVIIFTKEALNELKNVFDAFTYKGHKK